jgi:glyoxylase-like metal-dependent hydrolase (beta-lactamase superfamily II)
MQIIPGVHQITCLAVNTFLIVEEKLALVDTGYPGSASKIAGYIKQLGRSTKELELIIITHNHLDHAGGLTRLRKMTLAKVAVGKADLGDSGFSYPWYYKAMLPIIRPLFLAKPDNVDIQLVGGETLSPLGGLRIIATPGHTPGGISLYSPAKGLLIAGDIINHRTKELKLPPGDFSSNMEQAKESIKRLARLDFDTLCFGHGKPIVGGASDKLREWIERKRL